MAHRITIDDITAKNPRVDQERLERTTKLLARLTRYGVTRKEYELASPQRSQQLILRGGVANVPQDG